MELPFPRLTEGRRAGLLAAVSAYPLTRLSGTLPRPVLDQAVVSGTTMAIAYVAASTTTNAVRRAVAGGARSEGARDARTLAATGALALGAGLGAVLVRRRARAAAARGRRLPISLGVLGGVAETVTVSAAAGAAISGADLVGLVLTEALLPRNPAAVAGGVVVAGAVVAVVSTHPRFLAYFALPPVADGPHTELSFQPGSTLPGAIGRAVGVAGLAAAAMWAESHVADRLAGVLGRSGSPGVAVRVLSHGVVVAGFAGACVAGLGLYLTRFTVQNRLLEEAYAAVPNRFGVTGGPGSAYAFAALGREGRRFVSQAHTAGELTAVLGVPATDPVRVFVPLGQLSGRPQHDAAAVVAEMERVGAFEKGVIVLAVPTGDGYVSYVQTETVELLTAGDCATVIVPYAQIPSTWAFFAVGRRAAAYYALYARAISERLRESARPARLFLFGESLGSIVALDAFGPDLVAQLEALGFAGGLYLGVPKYSHVDRVLRPRDPAVHEAGGLQYAGDRAGLLAASPGHLNVTHPSDPLAVADVSQLARHPVDYWGRPTGAYVPVVSFLIELADVKNAMTLRPGDFSPSPGHDYRYDTALAVARAYDLPFDQEEVVERALRERELAWSVRRLLARRLGDARDNALAQLQAWGVDPATLTERFAAQREALSGWLDAIIPDNDTRSGSAVVGTCPARDGADRSARRGAGRPWPRYAFGCGVQRRYGLTSSTSPKRALESSVDIAAETITRWPGCQSAGVATGWASVSWRASITRRISSKLRPTDLG